MDWSAVSNASGRNDASRSFRIVHPFHPASGQEFEVVTWRHNWGEDRIYFHDRAGKLRSVPAQWTSVIGEDPVVVVGKRSSHIRADDLVELAALVRRLLP
jgi:hypothetical protein